jgi:solute carrier family 25 protein 44
MRSATVVPDLLPSHSPFLGTVPPHLHKGVSSWSIAQGIWRAEGVRGFYRGYLASVLTWCPFTSAYFATYEPVKELTVRALGRREADIHFAWFIIAGCAAGTVATVLTNPIDVVRTRLQVQGKGGLVVTPELQQLGGQYTGVFDAFRKIHALEGLAGFAKGMGARMLWIMPWTATGIVAYEGCKRIALS